MILLCLFRPIINCLLGKLEITRQIHLFDHLYIMITILSEVSSRKLYGTGTVYYLKPDHLINIQHFAVQNYFKFYFLV